MIEPEIEYSISKLTKDPMQLCSLTSCSTIKLSVSVFGFHAVILSDSIMLVQYTGQYINAIKT